MHLSFTKEKFVLTNEYLAEMERIAQRIINEKVVAYSQFLPEQDAYCVELKIGGGFKNSNDNTSAISLFDFEEPKIIKILIKNINIGMDTELYLDTVWPARVESAWLNYNNPKPKEEVETKEEVTTTTTKEYLSHSCGKCGASLEYNKEKDVYYCPYCGTEYRPELTTITKTIKGELKNV